MNILSIVMNSISQLIFFSLVPFIWWIFTARKNENFFMWIGLEKVKGSYKTIFICTMIFTVLCIISQVFWVPNLIPDNVTVQSSYSGQGIDALIPVLCFSMISTGLSEEILFRGFINKRLCNKFGFNIGNIIQGFLFGLLHGVLFFAVTTPFNAAIIILITGFSGWLLGYMTEKASGGSIIPAWLIHGFGNLALSMLQAFNII